MFSIIKKSDAIKSNKFIENVVQNFTIPAFELTLFHSGDNAGMVIFDETIAP